jgi:hypothetical protein
MVQNFVFFMEGLGAAKIRTSEIGENVMSYMQSINMGVVSTWRRHENKNHENFF